MVKTDSIGKAIWKKAFDDDGIYKSGNCVQQTADKGYIVVGYSDSDNSDIWVIKTDPEGNVY